MNKGKDLVKVEYVIPADLQEVISDKIAEEVKNAYLWNVGKSVGESVVKALESDGFTTRISDAVVENIKINEEDYISGVTEQVRDALMETTGIISKEVLKKVNEKVQSYGFIQIGR